MVDKSSSGEVLGERLSNQFLQQTIRLLQIQRH